MKDQPRSRRLPASSGLWIFAAVLLFCVMLILKSYLYTGEVPAGSSLNKRDLDEAFSKMSSTVASLRVDIVRAINTETKDGQTTGSVPRIPDTCPVCEKAGQIIVQDSTKESEYVVDCGVDSKCGGSGRGTCYIGKCFCNPGASGAHCELGAPKDCSSQLIAADKLTCFFHPQFGSARVDEDTWRAALSAESDIWNGDGGSNDRSDEHVRGYGRYSVFDQGADLGHYAEFGCGPWTQTKTSLMQARPDLKFKSMTLSDPNLHNYVRNVPHCSYKNGGFVPGVMTYLVSAGAEAPLFRETFDTLLMTNVLEHVMNAYDVLHNLWASLKPGGILIFNDRWVEDFPFHSHIPLNNLLHPVRVRKLVLEWLLEHFETLFRDDKGTTEMNQRGDVGTYFIGRKKTPLQLKAQAETA